VPLHPTLLLLLVEVDPNDPLLFVLDRPMARVVLLLRRG
jgi:hypothetical protein